MYSFKNYNTSSGFVVVCAPDPESEASNTRAPPLETVSGHSYTRRDDSRHISQLPNGLHLALALALLLTTALLLPPRG